MRQFDFKPAQLSRIIGAGISFALIYYMMFTFGFKQTHGTIVKALLAGALFSFGMWFISSLFSKQGTLNNRLTRERSKSNQN